MTHEMRHATWDTWWGVIIFSKYQLPRSYCLGGTVFLRYFHNGQVIDLMSNGGVCRAVPTTPCLLKGGCHNFWYLNHVSGSYELAWKCTFQENSKTKDCQKTGFSTFSDWILSKMYYRVTVLHGRVFLVPCETWIMYTSATFWKVPEQHGHIYLLGLYNVHLSIYLSTTFLSIFFSFLFFK